MTADTLHLHIDRADGSLQRLIGLIERRGFHIDGMTLSDEGHGRRVQMAVRGRDEGRSVETLGRQIDRLFGVTRLTPSAAVFHPEVAA
ncbi:ACT domain-containing protein [Brevundimonas sp.]|uniref:ACT domain-containing protein n=1 Tax=Brevundimonas sp. TaxID=1871086 RepID=UPI002737C522|nr:ACT domain-containing protein [Brevundimonas sp.]MDP3802706.1 ACT domain-containing protein [Brevundimonas sp.]